MSNRTRVEDPTEIRRLKEEEVPEVKRLCEHAHWPYTLRDLQRLYRFDPEGWFCATVHGQYAGQAMGMRIESLGCIGIVIVHQDFRRQGIATALTEAALGYLKEKGIKTINLDATPEGYRIYEKLGFIPEFSVTHYVRRPVPASSTVSKGGDGIEPLSPSEIDAVVQFDRTYFGVSRSRVLEALIKDSEAILLREGKIRGYAMVKPMDYENGYWLGPWAAEDPASAERLLGHVLQRFPEGEIRMGALESNPYSENLLLRHGFKVDFKITRMRFGPSMEGGDPSGIYGEAGHEKG